MRTRTTTLLPARYGAISRVSCSGCLFPLCYTLCALFVFSSVYFDVSEKVYVGVCGKPVVCEKCEVCKKPPVCDQKQTVLTLGVEEFLTVKDSLGTKQLS